VLDEATTGLDVVTKAGVLAFSAGLAPNSASPWWPGEHDLARVATVCEQIAVM